MALFLGSRPKPNLTGDTWQGYPVNPLKAVVQLRRLQGVITRALQQVTQPLLIIQGGRDMSIDQRSAEQIYQRVNSKVKELHWLEKSGHCLLLDQGLPQATLLTLNFLYKIR